MTAGAVSLKKSHDIVILSFCNIVKGQAKFTIPTYIVVHYGYGTIETKLLILFSRTTHLYHTLCRYYFNILDRNK